MTNGEKPESRKNIDPYGEGMISIILYLNKIVVSSIGPTMDETTNRNPICFGPLYLSVFIKDINMQITIIGNQANAVKSMLVAYATFGINNMVNAKFL